MRATSPTITGIFTTTGDNYFNGGFTEFALSSLIDRVQFKSGTSVVAAFIRASSRLQLALGSGAPQGYVFSTYSTNSAVTISDAGLVSILYNLTVTGGTITGGPLGLQLKAGGTAQDITLQPSTTGSLVMKNGAGTTNLIVRSDGTINAANLPTSSVGLAPGDLWVDTAAGNVVKRV